MNFCVICGYPITNLHHILPKGHKGLDIPENKIYLCPNHHKVMHILFDLKVHKEMYIQPHIIKLNEQYEALKIADPIALKYFVDIIEPKLKVITKICYTHTNMLR